MGKKKKKVKAFSRRANMRLEQFQAGLLDTIHEHINPSESTPKKTDADTLSADFQDALTSEESTLQKEMNQSQEENDQPDTETQSESPPTPPTWGDDELQEDEWEANDGFANDLEEDQEVLIYVYEIGPISAPRILAVDSQGHRYSTSDPFFRKQIVQHSCYIATYCASDQNSSPASATDVESYRTIKHISSEPCDPYTRPDVPGGDLRVLGFLQRYESGDKAVFFIPPPKPGLPQAQQEYTELPPAGQFMMMKASASQLQLETGQNVPARTWLTFLPHFSRRGKWDLLDVEWTDFDKHSHINLLPEDLRTLGTLRRYDEEYQEALPTLYVGEEEAFDMGKEALSQELPADVDKWSIEKICAAAKRRLEATSHPPEPLLQALYGQRPFNILINPLYLRMYQWRLIVNRFFELPTGKPPP